MQLCRPSQWIPCTLLSEMKAETCCEFSCSQTFQPTSTVGWRVSSFSRAGLNASMETAWHSFARRQTWRFSHPENAAAAPNAGLTFNTSSDGCRVEHQLKMKSRNTEKKCSGCERQHTPGCPALPSQHPPAQPGHQLCSDNVVGRELEQWAAAGSAEPTSTAAPACSALKVLCKTWPVPFRPCPQHNVKSMYNLAFPSAAVTADSKFV